MEAQCGAARDGGGCSAAVLEKADELAHAACDEEPRAEEESIAFFF
jgi:hypothetical protein